MLEAVHELGQHGSSGALEAQDERAPLTGLTAELDHLDEPKNQWADWPAPTRKSLSTTG